MNAFCKRDTCVLVLKNSAEWIHKLLCNRYKERSHHFRLFRPLFVIICQYSSLKLISSHFFLFPFLGIQDTLCCDNGPIPVLSSLLRAPAMESLPGVFGFFVLHHVIYLMLQYARLLNNPYINQYSILLGLVHEEKCNQGQTIVTCNYQSFCIILCKEEPRIQALLAVSLQDTYNSYRSSALFLFMLCLLFVFSVQLYIV